MLDTGYSLYTNCRSTMYSLRNRRHGVQHNILGIEGMNFNIIKTVYKKTRANIKFNGERLKAFYLSSRTRRRCPVSIQNSNVNPSQGK